MINRLCRELADEKKVKRGLNIHGLRHSLGNELYDLGIEREARKRMIAHDASSMVYEQGVTVADRPTRPHGRSTASTGRNNVRIALFSRNQRPAATLPAKLNLTDPNHAGGRQ